MQNDDSSKAVELSAELSTEFRRSLSQDALMVVPDDASFRETTIRWSEYQGPQFAAAVIVSDEEDIRKTIAFGKSHGIPFLVTTGKHGDALGLSTIRGGIQIDLRRLNKIQITEDGNSVTVGGGILAGRLNKTLWNAGKVTVTGFCETVGSGLWLGGGHGLLQGQFGLATDQLIEARVMLANGRVVTASEKSEPDLFWAIRGAGHNFGVVLEMKLRIYDAKPFAIWAYEMFVFSGQQVEEVFTALNSMQERTDPTAQYHVFVRMVPEIDPDNAVITIITLCAAGPTDAPLRSYSQPLHMLPSLSVTTNTVPLLSLPTLLGAHAEGQFCRKGQAFMRYPVDLRTHNISTTREVYDMFNDGLKTIPALATGSAFAFESYPIHAVRAVPETSTAFPWRADNLLLSPFIVYEPNPAIDDAARNLGTRIRDALVKGSGTEELHSYVNYAEGTESLEALYGHEGWRLKKLRELKLKHDADNVFGFFGGIH